MFEPFRKMGLSNLVKSRYDLRNRRWLRATTGYNENALPSTQQALGLLPSIALSSCRYREYRPFGVKVNSFFQKNHIHGIYGAGMPWRGYYMGTTTRRINSMLLQRADLLSRLAWMPSPIGDVGPWMGRTAAAACPRAVGP